MKLSHHYRNTKLILILVRTQKGLTKSSLKALHVTYINIIKNLKVDKLAPLLIKRHVTTLWYRYFIITPSLTFHFWKSIFDIRYLKLKFVCMWPVTWVVLEMGNLYINKANMDFILDRFKVYFYIKAWAES